MKGPGTPLEKMPYHVGIIMDGNGRWAEMKGLPRFEGHSRGAERAREIIKASREIGVKVLTLYTFSLENWQRPKPEIRMLMKLLELYLMNEMHEFKKEGICFRAIGEIQKLPASVKDLIKESEALTASCTGMTLIAAISYSGRNEILRAARRAIASGINPNELDENSFSGFLDTAGLPEPDLVIRTSGEKRMSNFLLWQSAYSELYFTETLWPDFGREELLEALRSYQERDRRFGTVRL
ncbi:MAG: polyprenyl diphosphate synthase [Nitrospiraceae bacterium]|nr:polyprenyl diphosphate synthase [Nitrospiraceae bacterium]